MARRAKGANGAPAGQVNVDGRIIGVELERFINQGVDSQGNPVGIGEVKVRPTNVTARIATVTGNGQLEENSIILLSNGPHGGFTQEAMLPNGNYEVNDVIRAVITAT